MNSLAFTVRPEIFRAADILVCDFMAVTSRDEFLLTVDTATDAIAASAILASAYAIGCKATMVTIPQLPFQGALANPYVPASLGAAAGACSVWIDLCWPYLAGSRVHDEAIKGRAYPSEPGLTTCWVCGCHRRNVRLMFRHAQPLEVRPPDIPRRLRGALSR